MGGGPWKRCLLASPMPCTFGEEGVWVVECRKKGGGEWDCPGSAADALPNTLRRERRRGWVLGGVGGVDGEVHRCGWVGRAGRCSVRVQRGAEWHGGGQQCVVAAVSGSAVSSLGWLRVRAGNCLAGPVACSSVSCASAGRGLPPPARRRLHSGQAATDASTAWRRAWIAGRPAGRSYRRDHTLRDCATEVSKAFLATICAAEKASTPNMV